MIYDGMRESLFLWAILTITWNLMCQSKILQILIPIETKSMLVMKFCFASLYYFRGFHLKNWVLIVHYVQLFSGDTVSLIQTVKGLLCNVLMERMLS
jgi:hypothetical protein